jgi:hypothetical protein
LNKPRGKAIAAQIHKPNLQTSANSPIDVSSLKKIGGQGGSNPGGMYTVSKICPVIPRACRKSAE